MPTTKRKSQDRKRVSSEKHEISYASGRVAKSTRVQKSKAKTALKSAKKELGRTTTRKKVMGRARSLARSSK